MSTTINPQEIFLLERYSSAEYFGELRDIWGDMIDQLKSCLARYNANPPANRGSRPMCERPDLVWEARVIPNFQHTFLGLCEGYTRLSDGDLFGLDYCHGPVNDFKGQQDYWAGWMPSFAADEYSRRLLLAVNMATNILATKEAWWAPSELTTEYIPEVRGPWDRPTTWPTYRPRADVAVNSGDMPRIAGIYVPDVEPSCAEFLCPEFGPAPDAVIFAGENAGGGWG